MREAAEGAWAAADEAEEEAAKAQARLEKLRSEGKEGKQLARAEKAAESAAEAADEAAAVAAGAAGDLQDGMIEQLLPSGWRQHTLDVFVWRHAELAAELAGGELEAGAAKELCGARAAALERYYGGGSDSRSSGGSSGSSSSSTSGGGDADALRDLQAALEESLARHPPPATAQALEQLLTLAPGKRFVRCERSELQLEQHSDFGTLEPETVRLLEGLEGEPEPLPTVRQPGGERAARGGRLLARPGRASQPRAPRPPPPARVCALPRSAGLSREAGQRRSLPWRARLRGGGAPAPRPVRWQARGWCSCSCCSRCGWRKRSERCFHTSVPSWPRQGSLTIRPYLPPLHRTHHRAA